MVNMKEAVCPGTTVTTSTTMIVGGESLGSVMNRNGI